MSMSGRSSSLSLSLSLSLGALLLALFSLSGCSPLTTVKLPDGSSAEFNQEVYDFLSDAKWERKKVEHGVPVTLVSFTPNSGGRYRCVHIAHSGGEYQGKNIAYIDPKDIKVTFATDNKSVYYMASLVDGILYCTDNQTSTVWRQPTYNIQVVARDILFADEIMYRSMIYNAGDSIKPASDPTSYTSRAAANQVVGVTGMPTLAEVKAERARLAQVAEEAAKQAALEKEAQDKAREEREKAWLAGAPERERLAKEAEIERQKQAKIAEKAKADAEAKRKAAEAQARAAERARVAKQSENYQVGYGYARSGGWETAGNNCETYAQNMSIAGKGKYAATKAECVQGAADGKVVFFKELRLQLSN